MVERVEHNIDFYPVIDVIIKCYDSEGNTHINDHRLENAEVREVDMVDNKKEIFVVGQWVGSSSSRNALKLGDDETPLLVPNELEIWKSRANTAEAKADYYKNLAREKYDEKFMELMYERITNKEKEELTRACYL